MVVNWKYVTWKWKMYYHLLHSTSLAFIVWPFTDIQKFGVGNWRWGR